MANKMQCARKGAVQHNQNINSMKRDSDAYCWHGYPNCSSYFTCTHRLIELINRYLLQIKYSRSRLTALHSLMPGSPIETELQPMCSMGSASGSFCNPSNDLKLLKGATCKRMTHQSTCRMHATTTSSCEQAQKLIGKATNIAVADCYPMLVQQICSQLICLNHWKLFFRLALIWCS